MFFFCHFHNLNPTEKSLLTGLDGPGRTTPWRPFTFDFIFNTLVFVFVAFLIALVAIPWSCRYYANTASSFSQPACHLLLPKQNRTVSRPTRRMSNEPVSLVSFISWLVYNWFYSISSQINCRTYENCKRFNKAITKWRQNHIFRQTVGENKGLNFYYEILVNT